ncbi:MAG: recombinase family protein [Candidatus Dormibacteria bacterium]
MSTSTRAGLYARVSTTDKGQDPELQLVPMRELAVTRGWQVTEYVDHASAADLRGRRQWRQLLEDARSGRIDLVVVWKLDRFARSSLDALTWLQQLDSAGVGFRILTQDIDTTTSAGRLVFSVLAAVAEMERELIRERVKAGMVRAKAQGKRLGRPTRTQPVTQHPMWAVVVDGMEAGHLTRSEAARKLHVRRVTLDAALQGVPNGGGIEALPGEVGGDASGSGPQ